MITAAMPDNLTATAANPARASGGGSRDSGEPLKIGGAVVRAEDRRRGLGANISSGSGIGERHPATPARPINQQLRGTRCDQRRQRRRQHIEVVAAAFNSGRTIKINARSHVTAAVAREHRRRYQLRAPATSPR